MSDFKPYLDHGWRLCRITPGTKAPKYADWNVKGNWVENYPLAHGGGLLHAYSGTMSLDIDNAPVAAKFLSERGVDMQALLDSDDAVQIVSGRVNSAKLLYAMEAPRPSQSCAEYVGEGADGKPRKKMALDFRCATDDGRSVQDVLPPSIHPDMGKPYAWRFGLFGDWRALPSLPDSLRRVWDEITTAVAATPQVVAPTGAAPAKIEQWLKTQDAGMCRDDWVKVGAKLHFEFQASMDGFAVWQKWSSGSPKWDEDARRNMLGIWRGFKLEGRALATLAKEVGTLPAEPDEFDLVVPHPTSIAAPTPGDLGLEHTETNAEREVRHLLSNWVVVQTGGAEPYFLLPGHPVDRLAKVAGHSGVELSPQQLITAVGPYMPKRRVGKRNIMVNPCETLAESKWRREVHRVAFNPGGPDTFTDADGRDYLNAYKPIPVTPLKPTASQIAPLEWLLRRILDDNGKPTGGVFAAWLCRLYAFVLRNPGVKVKWAPLLYSAEQGTGKTTLMETLPALLFGPPYVKKMTHTVLRERFAGAQFDSTWWCCLVEMHSDAGKVDAKTIANKLKPWITDSSIQIEKKGVDSYEIPNRLQFTAVSNHDDCLFMEEGSTDRRWLVGEMLGTPLTTAEMANINPLFGEHGRHADAVSWLHWYFLNAVDLTGFSPTAPPPDTAAKRRVREHSRSTWEDKIHEALEVRHPPFHLDVVTPRDVTENLLVGQKVSISAARTLLRKAGCRELPATALYRSAYCVRDYDFWQSQKPRDVQAYMLGGPRPLDDCNDLI